MSEDLEKECKTSLSKLMNFKVIAIISIGIAIRVIMLFYYYYIYTINSNLALDDVGRNYNESLYYPPLTAGLIAIFRFLSFGYVEIFAFWAFLWDLLICFMFYYVNKCFNIQNRMYAFSLFIINPFWFLNNSFSPYHYGYHITDSFFFFFFFIALIFYSKKNIRSKYLFYIFFALSICIKYYTFPAIGFFLIKYLWEKNWKELKIIFIVIIPIVLVFLITPVFYLDWYYEQLIEWDSFGSALLPLYIRLLPLTIIFILYSIFRLKKADPFEILIVSIIAMGTYLIFTFLFLRWFQAIIIYGILKEKNFKPISLNLKLIRWKININNHIITFYLSFLGVLSSYLLITFVFAAPPY